MSCVASFFFFNDTATTEIYTLSLHDALPILAAQDEGVHRQAGDQAAALGTADGLAPAGDLEGLDHVAGEQDGGVAPQVLLRVTQRVLGEVEHVAEIGRASCRERV